MKENNISQTNIEEKEAAPSLDTAWMLERLEEKTTPQMLSNLLTCDRPMEGLILFSHLVFTPLAGVLERAVRQMHEEGLVTTGAEEIGIAYSLNSLALFAEYSHQVNKMLGLATSIEQQV